MTTALTVERPATAAPGSAPRRPSLARLTLVELRKLADTRAGYWLLIVIALSSAVAVTVLLVAGEASERAFDQFFGLATLPCAVLLPVLGILSVTSEWSQRTAMTTFALVPLRHRVAVAKLAAGVITALGAVLVSLAVAAVGTGIAGLTGDGHWTFAWWTLGHAVLLQLINVLMGVAFGMLLLNSPLAIVLFFTVPTVWSILGELVSGLNRAATWLDTGRTTAPLMAVPELTGEQWAQLAVSVAFWVLLPLTAGLVRLLRREVS